MKRARPYDRDAALDAAMTLFWRKGYHATSLKDLEAALSMKPGSIYAAFDSKQALYLAALERYFHGLRDGFRAMAARDGSRLDALADFLRRAARREEQPEGRHVCMIVKTMLDATEGEQAIAGAARAYLDQMAAEITAVFRAARDAGETAADADPVLLGRRYQMNLTALRIEAQRGGEDAALTMLAEETAQEIERLRA